MQLILSTGSSSVVAIDGLESYLEHGSLSVRLDQVAPLLEAIREAAAALTPADAAIREADPARAARLAQAILQTANAARALAVAAPADDPNAVTVLTTLQQLQIEPSETNPVRSVTVEYAVKGSGSWPVLRFPAAARVLAAYLISNADAAGSAFSVSVVNAGAGAGTIVTADGSPGSVAAGTAYALAVHPGGPQAYASGDLAVVKVASTLPLASFSVQLDYQLAG